MNRDAIRQALAVATDAERTLLSLYLDPRATWGPLSGPQMSAYLSDADELYYGGAAGGGKSDLLLGLAATAHRKSLILRRQSTQLRELTERARQLLPPTRAKYSSQIGLMRLTDGRLIEFSACNLLGDREKWRGRAHDLKGFDELPTFLEGQYVFIRGWCRTTTVGQRCRTVSTGNPPSNAEGEWVIARWAPWLDPQHRHPARPGELRWFAVVGKEPIEVDGPTPFLHHGKLVKPSSRTFIPARLSDNKFLMATDYEAVVMSMPEPLRSQMLYGDHRVGRDDDPWQVIPTEWVRQAQARWRPDGRPRDAKGEPIDLDTVGVDVARGGRDKTVLSRRYGPWFAPLERHPGTSTPDGLAVARLAAAALTEGGKANVDVIGVGASVYDHLGSLGMRAVGINFAEGTEWRDRSGRLGMCNVRALAYWTLREALDPTSGQDLALPPDSELLADLCSLRWTLTARGVLIESKDDIKKRLGRSTDSGDAVALAHLTQLGLPYQHPSWAQDDDEDDD